ncbi:tRNA preQ1(34) S-adenosylmethionine ribosyltransferase-isomerase QueA [Candidatus Peregrinibacteria bacterium RIFCSPLOWO2_02_FULL_39_10]|nr:MAG: tRNA preQ1(34) S-adenosylmethionine ribosyltransferase-isomerase QueA [Candidatus Peregrinibacteria bacterium RIFCSPLOWO2_02_FULL_39_10]
MRTSLFDYNLPKEFIAKNPLIPRDSSKLLIYDSSKNKVFHKHFYDLKNLLSNNDLLVLNRSKVIPARILFDIDGGKKEIFILKKLDDGKFRVLVKPGKFFKTGKIFNLNKKVSCEVVGINEDGSRIVKANTDLIEFSMKFGTVPLPPYIKDSSAKDSQYQTVYAKEKGSVAAPTAGLHFTKPLLNILKNKGVSIETVLLHVGQGTFTPVTTEDISKHKMHAEEFEVSETAAKRLNEAKKNGKRIIAVGTTSVRVLESCYKNGFKPKFGETNIFIYPGNYKWKAVDVLITNFHLPKSTLIMLVASFLENKGVKNPVQKILELYESAKKNNYRFYSFGDAMMII